MLRPFMQTLVEGTPIMSIYRAATNIARVLPEHREGKPFRCHELARVFHRILSADYLLKMRVQDGWLGVIEHSWILLGADPVMPETGLPWKGWILDPYRPGVLPCTQLIDLQVCLPHSYAAGAPRTDIDNDLVDYLVNTFPAVPF